MADAIVVNPEETPEAPKAPKKAVVGISADVMAEIKAQLRDEVIAELKPKSPTVEASDSTFRVDGGKKLDSHDAIREDH